MADQTRSPSAAWASPNAARRAKDRRLEPTRRALSNSSTKDWRTPVIPPPDSARRPTKTRSSPSTQTTIAGDQQPGGAGEPPRRAHAQAEEEPRAGQPRRGVDGQRPATLAPPVHGAERVGAAEQDGADTEGSDQQRDRLLEGPDPQRGDHPGGAEELAVEEAGQRGGDPGTDDERPRLAGTGEAARDAGAEQQADRDQEQPVADVAEHHPEHRHVRQAGEHRRVDVPVRHGAVGLHQRVAATGASHCRVPSAWAGRRRAVGGSPRARLRPRRSGHRGSAISEVGIHPARAATACLRTARPATSWRSASPASRSTRSSSTSRSRSGSSRDSRGSTWSGGCSARSRRPASLCVCGSSPPRSISITPESATWTRTARSARSGATRATRSIRSGMPGSRHDIERLQVGRRRAPRSPGRRGPAMRRPTAPLPRRAVGPGRTCPLRSRLKPSCSSRCHQASSARHSSDGSVIPASTQAAGGGSSARKAGSEAASTASRPSSVTAPRRTDAGPAPGRRAGARERPGWRPRTGPSRAGARRARGSARLRRMPIWTARSPSPIGAQAEELSTSWSSAGPAAAESRDQAVPSAPRSYGGSGGQTRLRRAADPRR